MSVQREGRILERWPQLKLDLSLGSIESHDGRVAHYLWGSLPRWIPQMGYREPQSIFGTWVNHKALSGSHTHSIMKLESTLFSPHSWVPVSFPPLAYFNFFPFLLLFQLLPFSISLFPSANWPSQAGLGLYISGFEATSETKAKLWVWFGLRRAYWPRHVVFLGQTRERWGGEKNLCESSCVFEENPITTANLNVLLSRGWGCKLGLTSDAIQFTQLFYEETLGGI